MAEKRKMLTPGPLSAVDPSRVQTPTALKTVVSEGNPMITKAEPTQIDLEIMALLEHRALIENKFDLRRLMDNQFKKDYSFEVLTAALDRLIAEGSLVETNIGFELPHEMVGKPVSAVQSVVKPAAAFAAKDLREMGVEAYRILAETGFEKLVAMSEKEGAKFENWLDIASGDSIRGKRTEYEGILTTVLSLMSEKDLTPQMKSYLEQPPALAKPSPKPSPKQAAPVPKITFPVQCVLPKDVADALLYVLSRTDAPKVNVNALAQFIEDCSNE